MEQKKEIVAFEIFNKNEAQRIDQDKRLDQIISELEMTKHHSAQINHQIEIQKPLIEKSN